MDWRLALVAFAVLPLIVAGHAVVPAERARSYRTVRTLDRAHQRVPAGAHHRHGDGAAVPPRGAELRALRRRSTASTATPTSSRSSTTRCSTRRSRSIGALAAALIIWFGGGWTLQGTLTLGSLVAFLQYSQRFFRPISDMSEKFNILQAAMASSERIFKLLDEPVAIESPSAVGSGQPWSTGPATSDPSDRSRRGHIVFDHVWFAYNGDGLRAAGRVVRGQARRARRHRRRHRGGQVDADQPAAAVLRRQARADPRRRRRRPGDGSARPARRCSAWCCRTCTCSPARSPTTSGSGTPAIADDAGRACGGRAVHADAVHRAAAERATRAPVAERGATLSVGPEAAAVVRARAGVRPAQCWSSTRRRRASTPRPSC